MSDSDDAKNGVKTFTLYVEKNIKNSISEIQAVCAVEVTNIYCKRSLLRYSTGLVGTGNEPIVPQLTTHTPDESV